MSTATAWISQGIGTGSSGDVYKHVIRGHGLIRTQARVLRHILCPDQGFMDSSALAGGVAGDCLLEGETTKNLSLKLVAVMLSASIGSDSTLNNDANGEVVKEFVDEILPIHNLTTIEVRCGM